MRTTWKAIFPERLRITACICPDFHVCPEGTVYLCAVHAAETWPDRTYTTTDDGRMALASS